jgi:hypothetical protein
MNVPADIEPIAEEATLPDRNLIASRYRLLLMSFVLAIVGGRPKNDGVPEE